MAVVDGSGVRPLRLGNDDDEGAALVAECRSRTHGRFLTGYVADESSTASATEAGIPSTAGHPSHRCRRGPFDLGSPRP